MKRASVAGLAFLLILINGCESPQEETAEVTEGEATVETTFEEGALEVDEVYMAARSYLRRGQQEELGLGSYGYFVFSQRPTPQTLARHILACEEFIRLLASREEVFSISPRDLMVTHWPVVDAAQQEVCDELVANYDYSRAARIAIAVGKGGAEGPILAAWREPFNSRGVGAEALVIDMSSYSDADVGRAIRIWIDLFARDPALWHDNRYNLVRVREAIRNAVLNYDETTLAVITSIGFGED